MNAPRIAALKCVVWLAGLAPLAILIYKGFGGTLSANPIEFVTRSTGTWTLTFLLVTLGVTPLRMLPGLDRLIKLRRLIGLFAFCYAILHVTTYAWLDKFFDFPDMLKDVLKRPFLTAGLAAFLLLIPLAATSTDAAVQKLGRRNWQWLHRTVYVSCAAALVHFWWQVKADTRIPRVYTAIFAVLLGWQAVSWILRRGAMTQTATSLNGKVQPSQQIQNHEMHENREK
jgi:sulfoxide reductase heme-binding subunit YedZ